MAYYSGKHGNIFIKSASDSGSAQAVGSLRNWSLSQQMAVLDTTTLGATDRTIIAGPRSYTGSASMLYYSDSKSNVELMVENTFPASSQSNNNGDTFGHNNEANQVFLRLRLGDGGSSPKDIECYCYITSFSVSCTVGEVVTAEISFEGTGLPTKYDMF